MPKSRHTRALIVGATLALLIAASSVHYTVERGDTLSKIADKHGVSVADIVAANDITDPNLITVGQQLAIPGVDTEPDTLHVVAAGDTLGKIARLYGKSVTELASANSIKNANLIRIGQEIIVPGGTSSPSSSSGSVSPSPSNARSGKFHVVTRGESLAQIASQYAGVSVDDIVRTNGIINNVIYAGTKLFLDGPGYVAPGAEGEVAYKVRNGDRLGDIAHAHGVSVSKLSSVNGISNPNLIRIGQSLLIPQGRTWICPVADAGFFNGWGFPRGGGTRYHEGIDLFAPRGTPVRAPVAGTVEFLTGSIGGLQFRLDTADGVRYIGSHLDAFGKSGPVTAGEVIGFVGNTGNASGTSPHLHFGMYLNGTVVNPYPSLVEHGCK